MQKSILFNRDKLIISSSKSIITFSNEKDNRYLVINGKKAYDIGFRCGTCQFFFERLEGSANGGESVGGVIAQLNTDLANLEQSTIDTLKLIIPDGTYYVFCSKVTPRLVSPHKIGDYFFEEQIELWGKEPFWGLPHFPKTEYYRLQTTVMSNKRCFFEFLIPMFPPGWLDKDQLSYYQNLLIQEKTPAAVTLSLLDVKSPADWEGEKTITSHWCLSHYLIDGHHKTYAAAKVGKPLKVISFFAINEGISSGKEIADFISLYASEK